MSRLKIFFQLLLAFALSFSVVAEAAQKKPITAKKKVSFEEQYKRATPQQRQAYLKGLQELAINMERKLMGKGLGWAPLRERGFGLHVGISEAFADDYYDSLGKKYEATCDATHLCVIAGYKSCIVGGRCRIPASVSCRTSNGGQGIYCSSIFGVTSDGTNFCMGPASNSFNNVSQRCQQQTGLTAPTAAQVDLVKKDTAELGDTLTSFCGDRADGDCGIWKKQWDSVNQSGILASAAVAAPTTTLAPPTTLLETPTTLAPTVDTSVAPSTTLQEAQQNIAASVEEKPCEPQKETELGWGDYTVKCVKGCGGSNFYIVHEKDGKGEKAYTDKMYVVSTDDIMKYSKDEKGFKKLIKEQNAFSCDVSKKKYAQAQFQKLENTFGVMLKKNVIDCGLKPQAATGATSEGRMSSQADKKSGDASVSNVCPSEGGGKEKTYRLKLDTQYKRPPKGPNGQSPKGPNVPASFKFRLEPDRMMFNKDLYECESKQVELKPMMTALGDVLSDPRMFCRVDKDALAEESKDSTATGGAGNGSTTGEGVTAPSGTGNSSGSSKENSYFHLRNRDDYDSRDRSGGAVDE